MSLDQFCEDPWKTTHDAYEQAFFHVRPAPEYATAEVVVASLYRSCGFPGYAEKQVPTAGREFDQASQQVRAHNRTGSKIHLDTWRGILHGVLESPKQPSQSSKRFLQLCPVVPDVARYSGSARLAGNSWNPGQLIQRMILLGEADSSRAALLWGSVFESLSVNAGDDIWAIWLQHEFELRRRPGIEWSQSILEGRELLSSDEKQTLEYPARQFVRDLRVVLDAKQYMTRRQWLSLLEAIVRLAVVSHVLWLCELNHRVWRLLKAILEGGDAHIAELSFSCDRPFLTYGNPAVPVIRDYASQYLLARLGINLVLWQLHDQGWSLPSLSTAAATRLFLTEVARRRTEVDCAVIMERIRGLQEEHGRTIACKKGIGSNLVEFARHVLGQRQTAQEALRSYDQGYILRKKSEHKSSPWIVSLGPVAVLALVHCCLRDAAGPRSIHRLCEHLKAYGIDVDRDDVVASDLGRKLRMLGLVLDSPDAESGMLLVPPFDQVSTVAEGAAR